MLLSARAQTRPTHGENFAAWQLHVLPAGWQSGHREEVALRTHAQVKLTSRATKESLAMTLLSCRGVTGLYRRPWFVEMREKLTCRHYHRRLKGPRTAHVAWHTGWWQLQNITHGGTTGVCLMHRRPIRTQEIHYMRICLSAKWPRTVPAEVSHRLLAQTPRGLLRRAHSAPPHRSHSRSIKVAEKL